MLKTKVKAGSITNLTDARYFAAWEAEWLGFNFDQGAEDYISVQNAIAIKEWVDGVKIVGEFSNIHTAEDINQAIKLVDLDAVQLGMLSDTQLALNVDNVPIIKQFIVQDSTTAQDIEEHFSEFASCAAMFLLDFTKSDISWADINQNKGISKDFLKNLCQEFKIIIAIDFSGDMIDEFLEEIHPHGISVKGGAEEKIGFKSFDELDEVFETIEIFR